MENGARIWGVVAGLAIALLGAIGILTRHLPVSMGGLAAILAIAVIVGTRKRAERSTR